jgi:glycyl-tRNA synthetase alpha subunit
MPYYRIVIWIRNSKPVQGIRWLENPSISALQGIMHRKAEEHYISNFIDCEVQMLAKTSKAVQKHLADKKKKKDRLEWAAYEKINSVSRKEQYAKTKDIIPLGERKH